MARDDLSLRKQSVITSVTAYVEEAHAFLDFLDEDYPRVFLTDSDELRRKLEVVLDRIHMLLRDDRLPEAVLGFMELTAIFADFSTAVAMRLRDGIK